MRIRNKKGMELSVNFLVIIIISLVLFGMSLYFINQFRAVGAGYEASLDSYAVEQLRSLSRDKSFGLYPAEVLLGVGGSEIVGVGVTNNGQTNKFFLHIDFADAYDSNGGNLYSAPSVLTSQQKSEINKWISAIQNKEISISSGQFQSLIIGVNPKPFTGGTDVKSGLYEFNVCITTGDSTNSCTTLDQGVNLYPSGVVKGFTVRIE